MALEVHSEIFIERPASEVAQTMFNPKMDKIWIRSLSEVYPMESGLYSKGAKIERIGTLLNHAYSAKVLVLKYEPEKMVELYLDEPFEMKQKYMLREAEGGSIAKVSIASIGELPFNSPISVISNKLTDMLNDDLKNLKKFVESQ